MDNKRRGFYFIEKDEKLGFIISPNADLTENSQVPKEQRDLVLKITEFQNNLKTMNENETERTDAIKSYIDELEELAKLGLEGEGVQLDLSKAGLEELEKKIVKIEYPKIKNKYLIKLMRFALIISCLSFLIRIILTSYFENIDYLSSYFMIIIGVQIGAIISFCVRKNQATFKNVVAIEEDLLLPCIRLTILSLCSIVFGLLTSSGIVSIQIGRFQTQYLYRQINQQILFGVICGLGDNLIMENIYVKAKNIIP